MSDKRFMILVFGLIAVFAGAIFLFGNSDEGSQSFIGDPLEIQTGEPQYETNEDGEEIQLPVQQADHTKGAGAKNITLIEYGDFECPACFGIYPELAQVEAAYGDDITIVFRHYPLATHLNALAAHRASEAAANQGKFWEMHDLLFENQPSWSQQTSGTNTSEATALFEGYAEQLGLDMDQFRTDVESQAVLDRINNHKDSGLQLGVSATPTIYLNGEEVNYRTYAEFAAAIDQLIADQDSDDAETGDQTPAESGDMPTDNSSSEPQ